MNILDENIPVNQRQLLRRWRIPARQIGDEVGRAGMKDDEILVLLRQLRRPTLFTRDLGFFDQRLCHQRYSIVCLAVERDEAALFTRRVLRHPDMSTQIQRMGSVLRVSQIGMNVWKLNAHREEFIEWSEGG
jgi:hypothetical protein